MRSFIRQEEGFSLTELLVVLVIIGVLALLAIPRFLNVVTKAKTSEAKRNLRTLHTYLEAHYFEHDQYTTDLLVLGFEQPVLVPDGGPGYYQYTIELPADGQFIAKATSAVDFDKDGTFNEWQIDQLGILVESVPD